MNHSNSKNIARKRVDHLVSTISQHRLLVIVPTVMCTVLAIGYSLIKSNTWSARQSLVIRDDLSGESYKPGRFESLESLKLAQETILEIARDPQVIRNALQKLGPSSFLISSKNWPGEKVIEQMQGQITIAAPNGAEFGKTEVIWLNTKGSTRDRAREFIELMLNEVDQKLGEVRALKVNSMITELEQAVESAQKSFDQSAVELQEMDAKFGADLSTLRGLNLQQTGDGSLQQTIVEIRKEQRTASENLESAIQQRQLLANALEEPQQYLVTSSELLKTQPRLNQLVVGLSEAELDLAALTGKFTDEHMEVISAKVGIRDVKLRILKEIQASIHGLSAEIDSAQARLDKLKQIEKEYENRLSSLSGSRVAYEKLEQEVGKKSEVLGQARQELARIQSLGSSTANLLTRVGEPQVATQPDGPGKRVIVAAGAMCGLLIGFGLLMFVATPFENDDPQITPHSASSTERLGETVQTTISELANRNQNATPASGALTAKSAVDSALDNVQAIMAAIKNSINARRKPTAPKQPTAVGDSFSASDETTVISLEAAEDADLESDDRVSLKDAVFASPQGDSEAPNRSLEMAQKSEASQVSNFEVLELDDQSIAMPYEAAGNKTANKDGKIAKPNSNQSIVSTEMGSRRKDNTRPIDLTRSPESGIPEHTAMTRIPDATIQIDDYKPKPETETPSVTPPPTGESDDELSVEEIVQRIRARQIAMAKGSTLDIPQSLASSTNRPNPFLNKNTSDQRPSDQQPVNPSELDAEDGKTNEQSKAAAVPDQIGRLSDSLSKFCAPAKNNPDSSL